MKLSKRDFYISKRASYIAPIKELYPLPPFWQATNSKASLKFNGKLIARLWIDKEKVGHHIKVNLFDTNFQMPKKFIKVETSFRNISDWDYKGQDLNPVKSLMKELSDYLLIKKDQLIEQGNLIHTIIPQDLLDKLRNFIRFKSNKVHISVAFSKSEPFLVETGWHDAEVYFTLTDKYLSIRIIDTENLNIKSLLNTMPLQEADYRHFLYLQDKHKILNLSKNIVNFLNELYNLIQSVPIVKKLLPP